jgi:hypothetical protein
LEEKFVSRAGIAPTLTSDELFNSSDSESDEDEDEDNGFGTDDFNVEDMEEIEPMREMWRARIKKVLLKG